MYEARQAEGSENWEVVNAETEEVKATHGPPDAKEKAERQVRMLSELETEMGSESHE
jgi:hypothetical protein